jgi:transposase-like protein
VQALEGGKVMAIEAVRCPHCQSETVVKYGQASNGKERFRCQQRARCGRTFIRTYAYPGRLPEVKRQIVEMTLNGSGVRDIARVLQVGPNTVIKELKKSRCALAGEQRRRRGVLSRRDHGRGPPGRGGRGG